MPGSLTGDVKFALYRDIVIHAAAVVEGSLHYAVIQYISGDKSVAARIMPKNKKYTKPIKLHDLGDGKTLIACTYTEEPVGKLKDSIQFQDINKAAKKVNILSDDLFGKSEDIREWRNKIHLAGDSIVIYDWTPS